MVAGGLKFLKRIRMNYLFPTYRYSELFSDDITTVSLVGNLDPRRGRWNPFDPHQELIQVADHVWERTLQLEGPDSFEHTGNYAFRLILNHNPSRQIKASTRAHVNENCVWHTALDPLGNKFNNFCIKVDHDCELLLSYDAVQSIVSLKSFDPNLENLPFNPVEVFSSYQLNGFIWDELNMFDKFNPRLPGRSFRQDPDGSWSIEVPLRKNGGIDFRADGVYQFLISADGEEDYGFSCLNDDNATLVRGSGFSSSHGRSSHSAFTLRALLDGIYRFRLIDPDGHARLEVQAPDGQPLKLLNQRKSIQLLGSVFKESQFDPTVEGRNLTPSAHDTEQLTIELEVEAGDHVVNFAISNELFLDTMGFGCWIDNDRIDEGKELRGISWHGKPQEWNIMFSLNLSSRLLFTYLLGNDEFRIAVIEGPGRLIPVKGLQTVSLVGDFDPPLSAWSPRESSNLLNHLGGGQFQRYVYLTAGRTYHYKFVANRSDWHMVFADYELDGYGSSLRGDNPFPTESTQCALKRYGQLTTHGNPPAICFTPLHTGPHRFFVDIISGYYSVKPL